MPKAVTAGTQETLVLRQSNIEPNLATASCDRLLWTMHEYHWDLFEGHLSCGCSECCGQACRRIAIAPGDYGDLDLEVRGKQKSDQWYSGAQEFEPMVIAQLALGSVAL